jgi:pyridinium-3,5-bisthiocarboxylic acid mononucleotide nickel chelatase
MKVAYVDMIGGAAGDMLMAAWVDAGVDVRELERALRSVVADGWELVVERVERGGISATHLDLVIPGEDDHAHGPFGTHHVHAHAHEGRRLPDILAIVERSGLTPLQIERASAIYRRLAGAEARVHGERVDDMVFHQVGQIDAILDVAGTCIALDLFGIEELRTSAFPIGHGLWRGRHPNPGPASLDLMRGFPLHTVDVEAQLVSATGAAILTTLAKPGPALDMTLEQIGYGAGRNTFDIPNVVRVMIGERTASAARTAD